MLREVSSDQSLEGTETIGDERTNIGGHAMTLTEITKDGDFIVSSWRGKYKFKIRSTPPSTSIYFESVKFSKK